MKKKLLSMMIMIAMVASIIPTTAFAESSNPTEETSSAASSVEQPKESSTPTEDFFSYQDSSQSQSSEQESSNKNADQETENSSSSTTSSNHTLETPNRSNISDEPQLADPNDEFIICYHSNIPGEADVYKTYDKYGYDYYADISDDSDFADWDTDSFIEWNTKPDGSGKFYMPGDRFYPAFPSYTRLVQFVYTNNTDGADLHLYAIRTENVQLTINANGGISSDDDTTTEYSAKIEKGDWTTPIQDFPGFYKEDYVFAGWSTNADGSGITYQPSESILINKDTKLYAIWNEAKTITLYQNNSPNDTTNKKYKNPGYIPTEETFTNGNLDVKYWTTNRDGTGDIYYSYDNYAGDDLTLYAQWYEYDNDNQVVEFFENKDGSSTFITKKYSYDDDQPMIPSPEELGITPPAGKVFLGWSYDVNSKDDVLYYPGIDEMPGNGNLMALFAQWGNPIHVSYNGNGNTNGTVPVDNKGYSPEELITIQNNGNLRKTGYTFTGWNTEPDGSGYSVNSGKANSYAFNGDIVLYAQWGTTLSVTYDLNGGSGTTPVDKEAYTVNESATIKNGDGITNGNKTFLYWNTEKSGYGDTYKAGAYVPMNENLTLYAIWGNVYSINYHANAPEGEVQNLPVDNNSYLEGIVARVYSNTYRSGYAFKGWNTKVDGTGTQYGDYASIFMNQNLDLYAQWEELVEITFDANGGTGEVPSPLLWESGTSMDLPTVSSLTKPGFYLSGWSDGENEYLFDNYDYYYPVEKAVTLSAVWTEKTNACTLLTYNFNAPAGTTPSGELPFYYKNSNPNKTVKASIPKQYGYNEGEPTIPGYTFLGWTTNPDGTGDQYLKYQLKNSNNFSPIYVNLGSTDITLYAKWMKHDDPDAKPLTLKYVSEARTEQTATFYYPAGSQVTLDDIRTNFEFENDGNGYLNFYVNGVEISGWETVSLDDNTEVTVEFEPYGDYTPTYDVTYMTSANGLLKPADSDVLVPVITKKDIIVGDAFTDIPTPVADKGYTFIGWKQVIKYRDNTPSRASTIIDKPGLSLQEINYLSSLDDYVYDGYEHYSREVYQMLFTPMFARTQAQYQVEYYYNNKLDTEATVTINDSIKVGDIIYNYEDKAKEGFTLDHVEGLDLELSTDNSQNVIKVYYTSSETPNNPEDPGQPGNPGEPGNPNNPDGNGNVNPGDDQSLHNVQTGDQTSNNILLATAGAAVSLIGALFTFKWRKNKKHREEE